LESGVVRVPAYLASKGGTIFCLMKVGTTGAGVRQLQNTLNVCYGQHLTVDGIYGWKTWNAVVVAQRAEHMTDVDGVYGPDTAASIRHRHIYYTSAEWCSRP
jgi:peptidoglycan hydrolase-like protein with peptidoglycan-binding domain